MKSIQSKITLTYIVFATVIVAAVGVISSFGIEVYFKNRLIADLSIRADVIFYTLQQDSSASLENVDTRLRELARIEGIRITLIDENGKVIDDSDVSFETVHQIENHLRRPEVQEALSKGIGVNARHSATVGKDFIYVAKQIENNGAASGLLHRVRFVRLSVHLEELQQMIHEIRLKIIFAGIIVLIFVFGVSAFVSRRISKPIVQIAGTIEEIRSGNLKKHIPLNSDDEIGHVARAVNELVDTLNADIVKLNKLEQIRSEFLGNVSHELRTPIFAIQSFLETLLDGAIDDPTVNRNFLEKAYTHAARLNTLLNDLINISQIESGEMKMSFRYFQLKEFLEPIVKDFQSKAERRRVLLQLKTDDCLQVDVFGDKDRLHQALDNLIDNAIKYNKPDGRVVISCSSENNKVRISVSDRGVGIGAEHLPRIFERFYRVDKERSRETGGTGLGLAIVKHIVEAHGSKMHVESTVGDGSTFSFFLQTG